MTAPFLGEEGITISFQGEATEAFRTMTGAVMSPEPYQEVQVSVNLLKTQGLADLYEAQRQTNTLLGDMTVTTDTTTLRAYQFVNTSIMNVRELKMNGRDPSYMVELRGYYPINSNLFNL